MEIEMKIRGLMVDPSTHMPIVLLKDPASEALLPIWVGLYEANAIALEVEKAQAPRPLTHDLLREMVRSLNGRAER
jgi:bifunctional DNase/RNase